MSWYMRSGGTWRLATVPAVKVSGTWRPIKEGWVRVSGTWRQFYSAMTVFLANGGGGGLHGTTCSGSAGTLTITGGTAPYTYSWAYVSGSVITPSTPTAATTNWTWVPGSAGSFSSTVKCTVTDNLGVVVASNNATISWTIA